MTKKSTDYLEQLYAGNAGLDRGLAVYELALRNSDGVIVEIGAKHGHTTVALALGSRDGYGLPVYSVDPHEPVKSWTGETMYGPSDQRPFLENILAAGIAEYVRILNIKSRVAQAVLVGEPIGLLFWDTGTDYKDRTVELLWWARQIYRGGTFAINDTAEGNMGADKIMAMLVETSVFQLEAPRENIRIAQRSY